MRVLIAALLAAPLLAGCVSAVKTVVTAPVKAVGQVADWSTTSQDEADRQDTHRDDDDRRPLAHGREFYVRERVDEALSA